MKRIISLALCFLLTFTLCQPVFTAENTMTWIGALDEDWNNADNWDSAQVPEDGDYVIIPESSVVEYVYGETSVRLNCAGNLTVSGGNLKLVGISSLRDGKLDGEGDITIATDGDFSWNGGSIEGTGNLIIENYANFSAKASSSLDRYLINNGLLLITDSLRLTAGAEGSGNFNILEGQTLELDGNGSYDFNSSYFSNMGALKISNTCTSVQFNSEFTQQSTGTLEFDIGGPSDFTKLEVAGTASLNNSVLKINILDGYGPSPGDSFEILTCGSRTGTFSSIVSNMPEITFEPTYTDTGLTLTVSDETVKVWEVANAADLDTALNGFQSGDTIKLTAGISYKKGIVIDGKDITFDTGNFTLNIYNDTKTSPGVGLEVKNGGNVYLIGSGKFDVRQEGGHKSCGVKVTGGSTAMVTNVWATVYEDDTAVGVYADGTGSSIHVLNNVRVVSVGGYGAQTAGQGRIIVDGKITAMNYIKIDGRDMEEPSGVNDPEKPGYLKYCTESVTGIVWVKAPTVTVPSEPQDFTATPGNGQVILSWTAPASDGGAAISGYEVSSDNGTTWVTASTSASHTFTGLTNGTEYTFKVRAVNSEGPGTEASVSATPAAPTTPAPTQPGRLYTWGNNVYGQLGDGTLVNKSIPTRIGTDEDWTTISAGYRQTVALKGDGSLWTWGSNSGGQLGDGTWELRKDSPVRIGSDNDWAAVEAGEDFTVALKTDGSLWAWGYAVGGYGEFGTPINWNVPTLVDKENIWIAVSAGCQHTVAIKSDGSLWGWGWNSKGELGRSDVDSYIDFTEEPVQISTDQWAAVSTGKFFTVALKQDGSLWAWGWNNVGQLGDGTVVDKYVPTRVGSDSDTWLAVAAGLNHVVAIKADGSLWAWGGNEYGELGNGTSDGISDPPPHPVPAQIGEDTDWISVTTGSSHNGAFKTDGSLWLWGLNGTGQLGDGTKQNSRTTPERLDGAGTWLAVACGDSHTVALLKVELTVPTAPQNFTTTPGDGQVMLSWTAPTNNGSSAITKYQVSKDNGESWTDVGLNTSYTFTGLNNGTEYTFRVRAVNSTGTGAEASTTATPAAPAHTTHTVNFYSNGSLYTSKTVTGGSILGSNWPNNPTRSGYSFDGWFTGQNGAGTQYTSITIITADVDLYAKWSYNGGSSGGSSSTTTTQAPSVYKAVVKEVSGMEKVLLVSVGRDTGTVFIEEDPWHTRPQGKMMITMPSIPGVGIYSVGIPVPELSTSGVLGTLTLNTGVGSITVPSNMLTGVADADGNKAQITIGQGDKSTLPKDIKTAIGDRPLVQLTLSIDGKGTDWSNPNAPVMVSIPYTPTDAELANSENIVIWYIDGSGNVATIPNGHYDPATGMVTFYTTHFSNYAVAFNKVSFNDVTIDAWYYKAVSFIAAREITSGTGDGNYSPEAKLTRGQFIVMLMKAYGIAPDTDPKDNFADAGATYYTNYLAAAKRLSISSGIGNNMFAPDKEITRQEMFTLLHNALKVIGRLPEGTASKPLSVFADAGDIASWAKEAMTVLVETGTIGGYDGKIYPLNTSTRAEMAQVLYNLLSK